MKSCPRCKQTLALKAFSLLRTGRYSSYCKRCHADIGAERRKRNRKPRPYVPMHVPDPLNSMLRDMPGNRGPLLGAVEFTQRIAA